MKKTCDYCNHDYGWADYSHQDIPLLIHLCSEHCVEQFLIIIRRK